MDFSNLTVEQKRKLMFALRACVHGTMTNRRCADTIHVFDFKRKHGGPYKIRYDEAVALVMDLVESLQDQETWPGMEVA